MRLLLDTHTFIWYVLNIQRLNDKVQNLIDDEDNEILLTTAWKGNISGRTISRALQKIGWSQKKDLEAVTGYDFFKNLPTNIQEIIESNTDIDKLLKIPRASLKAIYDAEGDSVFKEFKTVSLINTSIWQSQIPNESIVGSEDRLSISGSSQASLNQNSSFQIGEEQIGILQVRFGQVSTTQISHTQVNIRPISSIQTGAVQASVAQIDISQGTADYRSSIQSSVAQVTSVNVDTIQVSTAQVNSSQINIFQYLGRTQTKSSKVTLSSSVPLQ